MPRYRVNFFDKNSDETRTLTVEADNEIEAEDIASERANDWPTSFKLGDVEPLDDDEEDD